jgi:hypothetical protein
MYLMPEGLIMETMKNKYRSCGLNYDLIIERFPDINVYEETVNVYLADEFFKDLKAMLENEDYALAKDAVKGLYVLAGELCLFPLYEKLLEVYEDLEYETYGDVRAHYEDMMLTYEKIRGIFNA